MSSENPVKAAATPHHEAAAPSATTGTLTAV